MTYQGERASPMADETGRCFEVSKVRIGADGHVSDVLWAEVGAGSDRAVGDRVVAPAADVVDAIHDGAQVAAVFPVSNSQVGKPGPERLFVVVVDAHANGRECIAFDGAASPGRELVDVARLDD